MRVSSNSTQNEAKYATNGATTKPIKDTKTDATSANAPKNIKLNFNELKGSVFASALKANLKPDAKNQVHEEMLQAGVVASILEEASPQASKLFSTSLESLKTSGMGTEDAVKASLKKLVQEGYLTQSDANLINGISFKASQLDSNLDALYDDKEGPNDNTIAVDSIDNAILKASEVIGAMQSEDTSPLSRSLDIASNTVSPSNSNPSSGVSSNSSAVSSKGGSRAGFLWKPVSDSNGKLVVLLPSSFSGKIESAAIYSNPPENGGTPIDQGKFSGVANGDRAHFRFSKPGSAYPDGAYVVAKLSDGTQATFQIGNSSSRNS